MTGSSDRAEQSGADGRLASGRLGDLLRQCGWRAGDVRASWTSERVSGVEWLVGCNTMRQPWGYWLPRPPSSTILTLQQTADARPAGRQLVRAERDESVCLPEHQILIVAESEDESSGDAEAARRVRGERAPAYRGPSRLGGRSLGRWGGQRSVREAPELIDRTTTTTRRRRR